jgi:putative transposase
MDPIDLIQTGRVHRFFRSTKKLKVPGVVSHLTQRAAGREPAFVEDEDYLTMMGLTKKVAEKYSLRLYAFCLMPNHVHLLLSPTEANLWDAMRDLFAQYARGFNRKYERKGHLFGGPYRQAVCLDESYLLAASLYIHLNPVNAGIVSDPVQYRWSSCKLYVDAKPRRSFVSPEFLLTMLSEDLLSGRLQYQELLRRGGAVDMGLVLEQEDAIERFRSKMLRLFPRLLGRVRAGEGALGPKVFDLLDIESLDQRIEEMKARGPGNDPRTRAAKRYLVQQLVARGYKREEIAGRLGLSRKTVYNLLADSR